MEPFMLQLPSTLPLKSQSQESSTLDSLLDQKQSRSSASTQSEDPTPIGKLLVLKSGKVVLRMASEADGNSHIDFEVIKGIPTNFY